MVVGELLVAVCRVELNQPPLSPFALRTIGCTRSREIGCHGALERGEFPDASRSVDDARGKRETVEVGEAIRALGSTRRAMLQALSAGGVGLASIALVSPRSFAADDEAIELVKRLTGRIPTESNRVRLDIPAVFPNGYTVPMSLEVDSPMTEADYVRHVRVLAPRNPLIEVADFWFTPRSGRARVSTRIRLAEPQNVLAVADMSDGTLLLARTWVKVDINGCA
jgi:sulfur-oxidizing protein SoxY